MISKLCMERIEQQQREAELAEGLMIAAWVLAMGIMAAVFAS